MAYAGHQFGKFVRGLARRAILLAKWSIWVAYAAIFSSRVGHAVFPARRWRAALGPVCASISSASHG